MTLAAIKTYPEIKIHRNLVAKSFTKVPHWLRKNISKKLPAIQHQAWCLLLELISRDPKDPANIKKLSDETGHSIRSLYRYMSELEKLGHCRIVKVRGDDGRFILTLYEVYLFKFFWKNTDTNWQVDNIIEENSNDDQAQSNDNNTLPETDTDTNWQKDEITTNSDSSYNKNTPARAHDNKTSNKTKQQQQKPVVVPLFDPRIESKLKEHPDIERQWIADSLKLPKQSVENILIAIDKSDSADTPAAWLRSALKGCWQFGQPKEIKKGISSNSNEELRKNQGKKVIYKEKTYEIEEAGSICTEFGCFNKYQIERAIENGVMKWI